MSARLFDVGGRQAFANKEIDWDTDTIQACQLLLDGSATDVGIKAITNVTNASPMVVTSNSHGFANGDIIVIRGVLGNLAANGTWQVANQAANTYELKTVHGAGINSTGSAAYTSGGCAINLTLSDFMDDITAARVGTDHAAIAGKSQVNGVLDANDLAFSGVTGTIHGIVLYDNLGAESAQRPIFFTDGKIQVVVAADASISATTLWVEPLEGPLASGLAIVFSNGVTATTNGVAAAGARSITVTALPGAIANGHTADAQSTGSGLPITLSSGAYSVVWDNTFNKIVKL